jgi:hypothetical protein
VIVEDALDAGFGALSVDVSQWHKPDGRAQLTGTWGAVCHIRDGSLYSVCMQADSDGCQHTVRKPGEIRGQGTCMRASRFSEGGLVPVADAMGWKWRGRARRAAVRSRV